MRKRLWCVLIGATIPLFADGPALHIHGEGWSQAGRIMHVTDTLVVNLNGNWVQSSGAQFTLDADFGDHLDGAIGFGAYQLYSSLGNPTQSRNALSLFKDYVTQSRFTYYQGEEHHPWLSFTVGDFPFNYNPDVKNLGAYLLRGPVYPGFLMGGFEDFALDTTKSNILGARAHASLGNFDLDLLLVNERDLPPTFDWSLAGIVKYKAGPLEVGAGVNFYRLIPDNAGLTTPSSTFYAADGAVNSDTLPHSPYELKYIEVDSAAGKADTVFYTHQGTKLMAMFDFDFKPLFDIHTMGPNDFKLYGEAAVLGVKNYGSVYHDIYQRIPVMMGFNVPTFGLLDYFSVEVEWYGARYRNDLSKIGSINSLAPYFPGISPPQPAVTLGPSPIPVSYQDMVGEGNLWSGGVDSLGRLVNDPSIQITGTDLDIEDMTSDNWKWSVFLEKKILDHIDLIAQVANDHTRPSPVRISGISEGGGMAEGFSSLKDWYVMFRMGYFF